MNVLHCFHGTKAVESETLMDTALLVGVIGVGGTLLGAVAGAFLNQRQTQRLEARERRNVRMLLRLECQYNIASLLEYWSLVFREGVHLPEQGWLLGIGTSNGEGGFDKRQRLAYEPVPLWRTRMWESQSGLVALALSPVEIDRVYALYSDLEAFTARREELRAIFDGPDAKQLAEEYSRWMLARFNQVELPDPATYRAEHGIEMKLMTFNEKTLRLWDACRAVADRTAAYRSGNPIEADATIFRWRDRFAQALAARKPSKPKQVATT